MTTLRVVVLIDERLVPPDSIEGLSDEQIAPWKTEYDVVAALKELGHEVRPVGVGDDFDTIRKACSETKPHVVFNVLEEFHGLRLYVPSVLGYLELVGQPYTGCNPRGLILAHSKALAKRILRSHRVRVPDFAVFARGRRVRRPKRLKFPLLVKSATEHGSVGIAQASLVHDDDHLRERVASVHEQLESDAIAEQYIQGREFYVGVMGNRRLETFPVWELTFGHLPEASPKIATAKVKWSPGYQKRSGVVTDRAKDLPPALEARIRELCKRVYRILGQSGCARVDLRFTAEGGIYVLECNPNPQLARGEDFADSAASVGVSYAQLIERIVNLGLRYQAQWKE